LPYSPCGPHKQKKGWDYYPNPCAGQQTLLLGPQFLGRNLAPVRLITLVTGDGDFKREELGHPFTTLEENAHPNIT
jgi:hypothetical protein